MLIDYYHLLYYFSQGYEVSREELVGLKEREIIKLFRRFPYRMAILMKYGNTHTWFENKMFPSKQDECYTCSRNIFSEEDKYEVMGYNYLENICETCYLRKSKTI